MSDMPHLLSRRPFTVGFRVFAVAAAAAQLCGCEDGLANTALDQHTALTEKALLTDELYANDTATLHWWPAVADAPLSVQQATAHASELIAALPQTDVGAFSIAYASNDFPQVALWIRRTGNQNLLIYNHGHSGLPESTEHYVHRFLRLAVEGGNDLLLTSMPLTGLNSIHPDAEYRMRTRDSDENVLVDPNVLTKFGHSIYEAVDDSDSYLHYFVDAAVMPAEELTRSPSDSRRTRLAQGNVQPPRPNYLSVSYVGLSGGATSGLATCAVLSLRRCVLIAGVMPDDLRVRYAQNFGDAEQQSRSIYANFPVTRLLRIARTSTEGLVLLFNERDSCCFAAPAATEFQARHPEYDIRVLPLDFHGYEPETVLGILAN